jgi:hypothetical protein
VNGSNPNFATSGGPPDTASKLTGRLAIAATALWGVVLALQTGLASRASLFLYYLEASRNADGVAGKITLWERVVYSFILSST